MQQDVDVLFSFSFIVGVGFGSKQRDRRQHNWSRLYGSRNCVEKFPSKLCHLLYAILTCNVPYTLYYSTSFRTTALI
jgi:hypothetical protein